MISSEAPKITTIVVNWNLRDETARCLDSLQAAGLACRVILVDNGSVDGSGPALKLRHPELELLMLPKNHGFGQACNLAIREALARPQCEYIFLLNNDADIDPNALEELLQAAKAHPRAGIFGPKIYHRSPARKIWYAGASRRKGVLAARAIGRGQTDLGQFDCIQPVDYVFGAAMFIRRSVFESIGLFDSRYFLYLEDLDFCLTAQQAGFSILFVPRSRVWHTISASTAGDLPHRRYHQIRSTILFLRKHLSPAAFLPGVFFWSAVFIRMLFFDLIKDGYRAISSYRSALISGYRDHIVRPIPKKTLVEER